MGTVVSLDIRAPFVSDEVIERAIGILHDIDRRFSLYRSDSELSRLAQGSVREDDLSTDVRWALAACDDLARQTGGAFDARRHRPDGVVDPSALVKGWAVEEAVRELEAGGAANLLMIAGGDLVARGEPAPGGAWRIGIRHPTFADQVASVLALRSGALATSGLYERGPHLRDPRTGQAANGLRSFSVVGPDLTWADAYATAGFVMGRDGLGWVDQRPGYGALAITNDNQVVWTSRVDRYRIWDPGGAVRFSEESQGIALS
ncbi:MAG: FAD:protein FMN transferase [Chloroflexota bacterium]